MTYLVLYQIGGLGRWFLDSIHEASDDALKHLRTEAREHAGRVYEMHCVDPHVKDCLFFAPFEVMDCWVRQADFVAKG